MRAVRSVSRTSSEFRTGSGYYHCTWKRRNADSCNSIGCAARARRIFDNENQLGRAQARLRSPSASTGVPPCIEMRARRRCDAFHNSERSRARSAADLLDVQLHESCNSFCEFHILRFPLSRFRRTSSTVCRRDPSIASGQPREFPKANRHQAAMPIASLFRGE